MQPLDATRLPPFDGARVEVAAPLGSATHIDLTVAPHDLWQRIRHGFGMPDLDGALVREKTAWYAARPDDLQRSLARATKYLFHIVVALERRGMPTELALLPMVESAFDPMAYSRAHASGLWQFIPTTGRCYSLAQNWWYDARRDIVASTSAALDYLSDLYELYGDWHLALAAYNWGEGALARAIQKNRDANLPTDYASLALPEETRSYVPKLQALKNIVADPGAFRVALAPIPNRPYFATVTRASDIDVQLAARLAEMPVEAFIELNPGLSRPLLRAEVSPRIVLPADRVERYHANLSKHGGDTALHWQVYRPRRGESLEAVAQRYKVPAARLRAVNGLHPQTRSAPSLLVVPLNGAILDPQKLPIMYAPPLPGAGRYHVVRRGDTLWGIARQYGIPLDDLKRWNKVRVLRPGQRVELSGYGYSEAGTMRVNFRP
ncbi:MAG: transglycosylase SLT domain-containing protein [Burkholderiales bacterium]|nr:transglycosylase SLT domain-containing protein [Burkholderiales bacterium]